MTLAYRRGWLPMCLSVALLSGCSVLKQFESPVAVRALKTGEYITLKRGDVLTTGRPGAATLEAITVAGLDGERCANVDKPVADCRQALADATGIGDERRLAALAELWVQQALAIAPDEAASDDGYLTRLDAWLEAARHAYAYLFFTARAPGARAFEDRQTQVRDYYNLAVQEVASILFKHRGKVAAVTGAADAVVVGGWTLRPDLSDIRIPLELGPPSELIPAASLAFSGLRSQYRRDGFGAELVAVMGAGLAASSPPMVSHARLRNRDTAGQGDAWSEMPYPVITALLRFDGETLAEVLRTRSVTFAVYDPYLHDAVSLNGQRVPLAGHFTAGYGLWLARSGFTRQSLRTLLALEQSIERPHVFLMQPYDPERRIVVMIHGLASSPEAWVNVANEIMGDETLRERFQIWQVYYPTNMPIALNHAEIRRALEAALRHFDPAGNEPASRDMVLIGHSMGGVIARLMVSSSADRLLNPLLAGLDLEADRRQRLAARLAPVMDFSPMPEVARAIFIAAPHRGTSIAGQRLGRWLAGMVRLPLTVLKGFADIIQDAQAGAQGTRHADRPGHSSNAGNANNPNPLRIPNSVDNLREDDPFVQAAAALPIGPRVQYHSIIARTAAEGALADTDDGLVPYRSAHLSGAISEKVIVSGHSVQETAAAILELRRILHADLDSRQALPGPSRPRQP